MYVYVYGWRVCKVRSEGVRVKAVRMKGVQSEE